MVWFQCEDCGENIKKPKLPNHFSICSAEKLSCIDCGEVFTKKESHHHRECITELEKYGPKGEGHDSNGTTTKPKVVNKNVLYVDFDIHVGLSNQPPWACSLCNAKMTSRKTLRLHAEGRRHISKARAFHASKQTSSEDVAGVCCQDKSAVNESYRSTDLTNSVNENAQKEEEEEGHQSTKRRKTSQLEHGCDSGGDNLTESTVDKLGASVPKEANHVNGMAAEFRTVKKKSAKACSIGQKPINAIKLKKLIISYLKSTSDGVMKMKKLKKLVLNDLQGDSLANNEEKILEFLEKKINSSSKLTLVGKMVHLVSKN